MSGQLRRALPRLKHDPQIGLRPRSPLLFRASSTPVPLRGSTRGNALLLNLPVWGAGTRLGLHPTSSPQSYKTAWEKPMKCRRLFTSLLVSVDDGIDGVAKQTRRRKRGVQWNPGVPMKSATELVCVSKQQRCFISEGIYSFERLGESVINNLFITTIFCFLTEWMNEWMNDVTPRTLRRWFTATYWRF